MDENIVKRLSSKEKDLLNKLEEQYTDPITYETRPDIAQKLNALAATLSTIPSSKGRAYAMTRILNSTPEFSLSNFEGTDIDKSWWDPSNEEDYIAPDIEKAERKRAGEEFWNWDSDEHWSKKNTEDLGRRAEKAGYSDLGNYLSDVRQIQTRKDREKIYDEESHKAGWNGGWGTPLPSTLIKLAYPRASEAVMRGEDIDKVKDLGLDTFEQGLYALDPVARGLSVAAKNSGKFGKAMALLGGAAANPTIFESADAIAYGDNPNSDRSKFNIGDVLIGTGINAGLGGLTSKFGSHTEKPSPLLSKSKYNEFKELGGEIEKYGNQLDKLKALEEQLSIEGTRKSALANVRKAIKSQETALESYLDKARISVKPSDFSYPKNSRTKYYLKELGLDAASLGINKLGDVISEDPKMTKRVLRTAAHLPGGFGSVLGNAVDEYYANKAYNDEKDKINQAIKLLGRRK